MVVEEPKTLIVSNEGETLEVKETTGQRADACETLYAFLNKDGHTKTRLFHASCSRRQRRCEGNRS